MKFDSRVVAAALVVKLARYKRRVERKRKLSEAEKRHLKRLYRLRDGKTNV